MSADTGLPRWLADELEHVPRYDSFRTADELAEGLREIAAAHPDRTTLERVGTSRQGEPLLCLTIEPDGVSSTGARTPEGLAFGIPHPNEPIGGLTALHLARRVAEDAGLRRRLGLRWRVIACIDPDGLRLNEGWLKGPFTRAHYSRHFYRPAGADQVEWTFPLNHEGAYFDTPIAETQALMRIIDTHRPALVCSLHNSELGGVYYYLSRPEPELHPVLQAVPEHWGLSLDRGEPESPDLVRLADGVFRSGSISRAYDRRIARGETWSNTAGDNTTSYVDRHGGLTLVSELPYWTDPRSGDTSPASASYAAALDANARGIAELADLLTTSLHETAGDLLAGDSQLWRASRFFATYTTRAANATRLRAEAAEAQRPATVAEATSLAANVHAQRLRFAGILLRALTGEVVAGNVRASVRRAHRRVQEAYEAWVAADAAELDHEFIEIRKLVGTQYAATISAAAHLAGNLA